jgi:hypothetical protein
VRSAPLAVALLALAACGGGVSDRVARAANAMEHLRGVRFSLEASSVATGSPAGDLPLRYRAVGKLAPPHRLQLDVTEPTSATLDINGQDVLLNGRPASATALRTLAGPLAVLEQLREPGVVRFSGLGFARGNITARYTIDRGDRGVVEVELGLLDDLVRRQTFSIVQDPGGDGHGVTSVRTTYAVEYWDYGVEPDFRRQGEPDRP